MRSMRACICLSLAVVVASCGSPGTEYSSSSVASSSPVSSSSVSTVSSSSSSTSVSSVAQSSTSSGTELIIQESTQGYCGVNGVLETEHDGYTGAGYSNALNNTGSSITWKIDVATWGSFRLDWRYANGGDAGRAATVEVNGNSVGSVSFPTTGSWTSWTEDGISVNLSAGENEIILRSTSAEGLANVDYLQVAGDDFSPVDCVPTGSSSINITDTAPGWASLSGGTTGGGNSNPVTVNSMSALQSAVSGSGSKVVLVQPGTYNGTLSIGANTTLIGTAPGVTISGSVSISGTDKYNIIMRNIAVRGLPCYNYEECKAGADGIYIGNGAHHVWLDHIDVADGQDGNLDVTKAADFVTISWSKFHYTYDKEHRFSNLIAGSDSETQSVGKLNITYMNCWWGARVDARQPRGRFGNIHMLNNYHNTGGSQIHGVGYDMSMIAENSHYDEGIAIWKDMGSPRGWRGIGNIGSPSDKNDSRGSSFTVPYSYNAMPASAVKDAVTSSNCGAGNTCTLQ